MVISQWSSTITNYHWQPVTKLHHKENGFWSAMGPTSEIWPPSFHPSCSKVHQELAVRHHRSKLKNSIGSVVHHSSPQLGEAVCFDMRCPEVKVPQTYHKQPQATVSKSVALGKRKPSVWEVYPLWVNYITTSLGSVYLANTSICQVGQKIYYIASHPYITIHHLYALYIIHSFPRVDMNPCKQSLSSASPVPKVHPLPSTRENPASRSLIVQPCAFALMNLFGCGYTHQLNRSVFLFLNIFFICPS